MQSFNFDENRSNAKLSDKVTVVNVPVYVKHNELDFKKKYFNTY